MTRILLTKWWCSVFLSIKFYDSLDQVGGVDVVSDL